jgi:geranylgeranyl reductase family protein
MAVARDPRTAWDLVVVGAGPAGAATALGALREEPRLRVLLLDRADFPRDKCCGDGIAPHAVDVLAGVGAGDVVAGWPSVDRLELSRGDRDVAGCMARPGHVVPRAVLDARLVERAVAAGAVLRRHRVSSVALPPAGGGPVRVDVGADVRVAGGIEAPVVVGADGAHSAVRAAVSRDPAARRTRTALAIRGYAPTPPGRAGRQVIRFGARRRPSYAWSFDRGDGLANVGYGELLGRSSGTKADPPTRALMLAELERLLPGSAAGATDWRAHHLPLSTWRWDQPDGPVLLAGDAAGLVNPLTGEGIFYAVATGVLAGRAAARAVRDGAPATAGAAYRRAVRLRLARHLRHTWAASRLSARAAVLDAGLAAAGRDRRVFDDLVELGLGDGRITPRLGLGLAAGLAAGLTAGLTPGRASPPARTGTSRAARPPDTPAHEE